MLKRLIIGIIFLSMMLHCAGRMGVLSYLYEQRHRIAIAIGVAEEVPMTMCGHKHSSDGGSLVIIEHDQSSHSSVPSMAFSSQEIHLFLSRLDQLSIDPAWIELALEKTSAIRDGRYNQPTPSIFHPPS